MEIWSFFKLGPGLEAACCGSSLVMSCQKMLGWSLVLGDAPGCSARSGGCLGPAPSGGGTGAVLALALLSCRVWV